MGKEEQEEELEVLDSIFPDEITHISDTTFSIDVALDVPDNDPDDSETPSILLTVSLPSTYPSTPPDLSISYPHSKPRPAHLSLPEDTPTLLSTLDSTVFDNLESQMIFTLVSALKEAAETLMQERITAQQEATQAEARQAEEQENRKFEGEKVTRERFLEWRGKFRAEMVERREEEERRKEEETKGPKRRLDKEEGKLTGRQLWEQGMVGKGAEDEDEGEDALDIVVEKLKVSG